MKRILALILAAVLMLAPAICSAGAVTDDGVHTPEDSPVSAGATTVYVYDSQYGVWNIHKKAEGGGTIPIASYQRTELKPWGTQYVEYLPASMDRPMFFDYLDRDGTPYEAVKQCLTGNDVFTSGSIGTPESTGTVDFGGKSHSFTWTLKDGVLFIDGDTGMLNYWSCPGNSPWCDNPYIRTVIVTDTIIPINGASFVASDLFYNCPNLETLIVVDGDGEIRHNEYSFTNFVNADGNPQALPYAAFPETGRVIVMAHGLANFEDVEYSIEQTRNGTNTHTCVETFPFGNYIALLPTAYSTRSDYDKLSSRVLGTERRTWNPWSDSTIKQLIESAYLTQDAADLVNAFFAEHDIDITVTADAADAAPADPTPSPEPTPAPQPAPQPTPADTGCDPEKTDGGTAADPICSSWARDKVMAAWDLFSGRIPVFYTGACHGPNIIEKDLTQPITRAEFATLAVAAYDYILGDTLENNGTNWTLHSISMTTANAKMTDVFEHYYAGGIVCAINMGLMNGYSETVFGSDDHLTREQAATVLGRIADRYSDFPYRAQPEQSAAFPPWTDANPYTDAISGWALDGVLRARAAGIMIGTGDTTFGATDDFTREQALITLYRMVEWCKPWYHELTSAQLDNDDVHDAANPFLHRR